jgi:hypothetical protein
VLLCERCHGAKTSEKLSVERVRDAKAKPFNAGRAFSSEYPLQANRQIRIEVVTNVASHTFPGGNGDYRVIWINGQDFFVLHCEDGWLTVSFVITDENGKVLLTVESWGAENLDCGLGLSIRRYASPSSIGSGFHHLGHEFEQR